MHGVAAHRILGLKTRAVAVDDARVDGAGAQTMPVVTAPVSQYTAADISRILRVPRHQIVSWQRAGLVDPDSVFSFRDLATMRRLRDLRQAREPRTLSAQKIASSVRAMGVILGSDDPLQDSAPVQRGARLVFRHGGALLDPLTQQFGFDFEPPQQGEATLLRMQSAQAIDLREQMQDQVEAQEIFQRAVALEERPETAHAAADLYRQAIHIWPLHAAASINLGTILYNQKRYEEAEQMYRAAASIDPDYALAFFDLGNVLDELRRLPEAIEAYRRAIQIVPQYADAHYNLALAYERLGERRRALRHWLAYVRMDPVGPWATHARMQARRTLANERLSIVTRRGRVAG